MSRKFLALFAAGLVLSFSLAPFLPAMQVDAGVLPQKDGRSLNFDFETGDLILAFQVGAYVRE